jgi:dihydrofolate reductase
MTDPQIAIIVAVASNGVIGDGGGMPWRLSTDLKRFKAITLGKPVVMGRKTFQAIGRPLPGRHNIVLTRDDSYSAEGVETATSMREALRLARDYARPNDADEICVIGGGEIYAMALPLADVLRVTHVEAMPDGDTRFPPIDGYDWDMIEEQSFPIGPGDSDPTRYAVYRRSRQ